MLNKVLLVLAATALLVTAPGLSASAQTTAEATCTQPQSDAESLYIISNLSPSLAPYFWTKTDLTITIQAEPQVDPAYVAVVENAVRTWQSTLDRCLDGAMTLTYVPSTPGSRATTDIVVHLVKHAGGWSFGGRAECTPAGCNNVIVSTDTPPGKVKEGEDAAPIWYVEGVAQHEIGHALGLGHTVDISSTDLMGYGWISANYNQVPHISQCDVDALAYIYSWAIEGTQPARPQGTAYTCAA
jgi:predicted Zn-dependent protease